MFFTKIFHLFIIIIPITFNYHIKSCFTNKKYSVTIQTRLIQIVNCIFKIIGVQNQLPITFSKALMRTFYIKIYIYPAPHTQIYNLPLHIKPKSSIFHAKA